MAKYVKLADPTGGFYDPETGFQIAHHEIKQLGPRIGRQTRIKMIGLGLVEVEIPKPPEINQEVVADAVIPPTPKPTAQKGKK